MHAGELIESFEPFTQEAAARWLDAVLAESSALRVHDEGLFPAKGDAVQLQSAHRLRDAWAHWADDAERLLKRLRMLPVSERNVPRADELFRAVGRARAMLKLTPEIMI